MDNYNKLKTPPSTALKSIKGGRLKGMNEINPQWRIEKMTEVYGECGVGWKYEITNKNTIPGDVGQVFAFVDINLYTKKDDCWSEPIPGTGGSMLITLEQRGLYCNDEAFKMALTDALGGAMKTLGMAADVYMGLYDGSKYGLENEGSETPLEGNNNPWLNKYKKDTKEILPVYTKIIAGAKEKNISVKELRKHYKINKVVAAELVNDLK